ncbi:GCN5 family acetyltransferase [Opitutaceae bacterium TAV5]|nr:GCN5 family acetyltransferase [Opitutaceae bacterium TAV5]
MSITRIPLHAAARDLLLLADPSPESIAAYPPDSLVFCHAENGEQTAVAVLRPESGGGGDFELLAIAVRPDRQTRGVGSRLLRHALDHCRAAGASCVTVGTGNSSLGPLAFYQKHGFRITGVIPDHFAGYRPPIFENGIRCLDLIRLTCRFE